MRRLSVVLLLLAGCTGAIGWTVTGGTPDEQAQALAIEAAAERVFPGSGLESGGQINLRPDLSAECWVTPPLVAAGCVGGGVWVLWPHPKCPAGSDLTCSALSHELCHVALGNWATESQADACSLLVNQEYRRTTP